MISRHSRLSRTLKLAWNMGTIIAEETTAAEITEDHLMMSAACLCELRIGALRDDSVSLTTHQVNELEQEQRSVEKLFRAGAVAPLHFYNRMTSVIERPGLYPADGIYHRDQNLRAKMNESLLHTLEQGADQLTLPALMVILINRPHGIWSQVLEQLGGSLRNLRLACEQGVQ